MDKEIKLNSPRSLEVCKTNGIQPYELYYIDYKEYLSKHPEISSLPEDIKRYRFNLLERLRLKTIKMIKEKRKELINIKDDKLREESEEYKTSRKKWTDKFRIKLNESEYHQGNKTFSEKMSSMIQKERANINKIKKKKKQNIEYMIESQMNVELINNKNIEKDKKIKENKEKKKKEFADKGLINKKIMEEKKKRKINIIDEMMKKRVYKISTKHDKLDKKRNEMLQEKKKQRDILIQKRNEELIKVSNHRSQLDIFIQEKEKKLIEQKLNNEEKEKRFIERVKTLQQKKKEMNYKKREKSVELLQKNHEKKEEQLYQLIQKINFLSPKNFFVIVPNPNFFF